MRPSTEAPSPHSTPPSCHNCPSTTFISHHPQWASPEGASDGGSAPHVPLPHPALLQGFLVMFNLAGWELQVACWKLLKGRRLPVPTRPGPWTNVPSYRSCQVWKAQRVDQSKDLQMFMAPTPFPSNLGAKERPVRAALSSALEETLPSTSAQAPSTTGVLSSVPTLQPSFSLLAK